MRVVSPAVLAAFMDYRELSVRQLAHLARVPAGKGKTRPLSPAIVGHLRSGYRRTCTPATARAIEKALKAPPGVLFKPEVALRRAA